LDTYPITEDLMADTAVVEVALDVRVTVKLVAEFATEDELRRLVERDPESVRGAILARIESPGLHGEKEAGWLDEDRCAFVTEIIDADSIKWARKDQLFSPDIPEVVA
jgi:hypothetical protein